MTSQELLNALLTALDSPSSISFGQDKLDLWPNDLREALFAAAILKRGINSDCVDCPSCGSVHVVHRSLPRAALLTYYFYDCPFDGKQTLQPADLHAWTLDCKALADWLAQQMPGGSVADELISARLWRIGKLSKSAVYLASGLSSSDSTNLLAQVPRRSIVISLSAVIPPIDIEQTRVIASPSVVSIHDATVRLDLEQLKALLSQNDGAGMRAGLAAEIDARFSHSDDFRSVRLDDTSYTLTAYQARVVEALYEAAMNGRPELEQQYLLVEVLDTSQKRLQSIFKSIEKWQQLVAKGTRRGMYRLNL